MFRRYFTIDLGSVTLSVITTCCCLLLLEVTMRFYIFGERSLSYDQMKSVHHIGRSGLLQASENLDILWELRPNLNTRYKFWPFQTNSQGLRDKEYTIAKPPDTFRVAVIGDSFTMPEGVPIERAYHSILEDRFNQDSTGRRYEFINFGVAGYSLVQYLSTIKRKVLAYQPDVILIGFCAANDSKLPNLDAFRRSYQVKSEANGFVHFYSLELLGNIYKTYYNKLRGRYAGYNADGGYMAAEFQKLAEIAASGKTPVIIAYIDNKAASADFSLVRDMAKQNGFEFINATTKFAPEISNDHIIYLTDKHPNAAANEVIADTLYPQLRASAIFRGASS